MSCLLDLFSENEASGVYVRYCRTNADDNNRKVKTMLTKINPMLLGDFDNTVAYYAADLGLEPGEWDFVTYQGNLKIYEDYECISTRALDGTQPPIELLGKQYKPSDLVKEVDPDSWEAFVEMGIAYALNNNLIRRII